MEFCRQVQSLLVELFTDSCIITSADNENTVYTKHTVLVLELEYNLLRV